MKELGLLAAGSLLTVVGAVAVRILQNRQEHKSWLRAARLEAYAAVLAAANEAAAFFRVLAVQNQPGVPVEDFRAHGQATTVTASRVRLLGPDAVAETASNLMIASMRLMTWESGSDIDRLNGEFNNALAAFEKIAREEVC